MPDNTGADEGLPTDVNEFGQLFQQFLRDVVHRSRGDELTLAKRIETSLGVSPIGLPIVSRSYPSFELPNIQLALDGIAEEMGEPDILGVSGIGRLYRDFSELLADSDYKVGPVDYRSVPVGDGVDLTCLAGAMVLLHWGPERVPMALWLRGGDPDDHNHPATLEAASPQREVSEAFFQRLEVLMSERNVFRGKVVSMSSHAFSQGVGPLRFHDPRPVSREQVILPGDLLERIERQVAGIAEHREFLRSHDQHLKRGVLLFGPPGTGKTHVINYLLGQLPGFTVVLVSGTAVEKIAQACDIARKLHPALVIVEDVDLIAEDRGARGGSHPLLLQLLNELDGIGNDVDVAFILTTNQIEVLERALAARPGRVDLAVEVPLPDKEGRRRLFRLYAEGLGLSDDDVDRMADRCEGVTASFAKEAMRRAVLLAGVRGSDTVEASDLEQSLDELLSQRDDLTRRLLGARMSDQYPSDERKPGNYI
ncbi:MAG: ATP-binding protein [Candidatus Nanopelagicales bacterium]